MYIYIYGNMGSLYRGGFPALPPTTLMRTYSPTLDSHASPM